MNLPEYAAVAAAHLKSKHRKPCAACEYVRAHKEAAPPRRSTSKRRPATV